MNDSPRKVNKAALIVMLLFVAAIVGVIVYANISSNNSYTSWEPVFSFENINEADFIRTHDGFIAFNRDGAAKYAAGGNIIWNISYQMEDPIAAECGDYAVFADRGSQTVHITDGTGSNHTFSVSEKIVQVCVADKGITAVRTNAGDSDRIYLYDINGNMLLDMKTEVKKSGFPITMALSDDGKKLVTSYFEVGQENKGWLTFYNFDDVGQNYSDKMVGSFSFDENLIVDIRMLNDSRVAVFYADGCNLYKFREKPEFIKTITVDGGIEAVCDSGDGFAIARKEAENKNSITVYDVNGKAVTDVIGSMGFDTMRLENGELILISDDSYVIYRKNGDEKLRARFDDAIRLIYPGSSKNEYIIVGKNKTEIIRLRTLKEDAANTADEQ
ncbi:MAG: hypothetical protein J5824_10245 [Lachnospiraceae bacterium]|nr:hypothetical protein [Lachnospiraceae bacterium]